MMKLSELGFIRLRDFGIFNVEQTGILIASIYAFWQGHVFGTGYLMLLAKMAHSKDADVSKSNNPLIS